MANKTYVDQVTVFDAPSAQDFNDAVYSAIGTGSPNFTPPKVPGDVLTNLGISTDVDKYFQTGDTDYTQAFVRAFAALSLVGGGTLRLRDAKTYQVSPVGGGKCILIPSNCNLMGGGYSSVIKLNPAFIQTNNYVIQCSGQDNVLSNFRIEGSLNTTTVSNGSGNSAIALIGAMRVIIDNVWINDVWGDGIYGYTNFDFSASQYSIYRGFQATSSSHVGTFTAGETVTGVTIQLSLTGVTGSSFVAGTAITSSSGGVGVVVSNAGISNTATASVQIALTSGTFIATNTISSGGTAGTISTATSSSITSIVDKWDSVNSVLYVHNITGNDSLYYPGETLTGGSSGATLVTLVGKQLSGLINNTPAAGETVTGATSGATGTLIVSDDVDSIYLDNVIGTFQPFELITGSTSNFTAYIYRTPINLFVGSFTAGAVQTVFTYNETVTGGTSGATAQLKYSNQSTRLFMLSISGTFVPGETITGATSGCTCVLVTPVSLTGSSGTYTTGDSVSDSGGATGTIVTGGSAAALTVNVKPTAGTFAAPNVFTDSTSGATGTISSIGSSTFVGATIPSRFIYLNKVIVNTVARHCFTIAGLDFDFSYTNCEAHNPHLAGLDIEPGASAQVNNVLINGGYWESGNFQGSNAISVGTGAAFKNIQLRNARIRGTIVGGNQNQLKIVGNSIEPWDGTNGTMANNKAAIFIFGGSNDVLIEGNSIIHNGLAPAATAGSPQDGVINVQPNSTVLFPDNIQIKNNRITSTSGRTGIICISAQTRADITGNSLTLDNKADGMYLANTNNAGSYTVAMNYIANAGSTLSASTGSAINCATNSGKTWVSCNIYHNVMTDSSNTMVNGVRMGANPSGGFSSIPIYANTVSGGGNPVPLKLGSAIAGFVYRISGGASNNPGGAPSSTSYYGPTLYAGRGAPSFTATNGSKFYREDGTGNTGTTIYTYNAGQAAWTADPYIRGGTFTLSAAATTVVSDTTTTAGSTLSITPTNAAAATLMQGTKSLYLSARSANTSFTVATADATAAAGTETFQYTLTN